MSWFHSSTEPIDAHNHASPAEIVACFQDHRNVLGRLAFLITGDQATADQAVVQACEIRFKETVHSAIGFSSGPRLRPLPVRYHTKRRRFASVKPRTKIDDAHMSSTYRKVMLKNARLVSTSFLSRCQNSDCGIRSAVPGSPGTQSCNPIVDSRLRFTPERVPRGSARC